MKENLVTNSSVIINAPINKVWDALINPEIIKQYLFGSDVISDWKEGSSIIYKGNYKGKPFEDKGKVVKIEPEELLVLTHWSPLSGTPDLPENYHTVTYHLEEENEGIKTTINQDNNSSEEERIQNEQFWTAALQTIKKLLET